MARSGQKMPPLVGSISARSFWIFTPADVATIWKPGIPPLSGTAEAITVTEELNQAFMSAELAALRGEAGMPPNERRAFYIAVAERTRALLELLRDGDIGNGFSEPRVMRDWAGSMLSPMQARGSRGRLPDELLRAAYQAVPDPDPPMHWYERPQWRLIGASFDPDVQRNKRRATAVLRDLPQRLEVLAALAALGVEETTPAPGGKRGGGNRCDIHMGHLMRRLAQVYFEATNCTPVVDKGRGDRNGPAALWVDNVVQLAGRRVQEQSAPVMPDGTAAARIVRLLDLSQDTLAEHFKGGWAVCRRHLPIKR